MEIDTKEILGTMEEQDSFLTLEELDNEAFRLAKKHSFEIKKVGESFEKRPIYLIKTGNGKKKAFVWGFPHPNEPIGSVAIKWLIDYFGKNKEMLEKLNYTWYFILVADPDGAKLNEGWFKEELTIEKYVFNFYRPSANR